MTDFAASAPISKGLSKSSGPAAGRHHALDLIRGLAALAVSQYHFMYWNGIAHVESMGTFAVYLFFVLSGLTMMMIYGDRFAGTLTRDAVARFYRKRLARLLPLLLVVAFLAFIRTGLSGTWEPTKAIMTGTGLMALHMPGFMSNSIGAWSLGIELAFYAVFPIVALLARNWKPVALAAIALLVAQHALLWQIHEAENFWPLYILIRFDRGGKGQHTIWAALALLAIVAGYSALNPSDLMRDQLSYLLLTALSAGVVWAAWRSELPNWLFAPAAFLGNVSYSLYLTHWIANDLTRIWGWPIAVQWAAYLGLALSSALLTYHLFENPMRKRFGHHSRPNASS